MMQLRILFHRDMLRHNVRSNVEGPQRLAKLAAREDIMDYLPSVKRDKEELLGLVHTKEYIERIKAACRKGERVADVRTTPNTYAAALIASAISVDAAMDGDFAAVRPPGHHASASTEGGFCLFNNMAIASTFLADQGKKVLVIDIDAHPGDGTQRTVESRARQKGGAADIIYISISGEGAWPLGAVTRPYIARVHNNIVSLNMLVPAGAGDDMLAGSVSLAMHIALQYKPDVIGVSFGADGHQDEGLGLKYTERGFYDLGITLRQLGVKTFAVLEGGYHRLVCECIDFFIAGIEGRRYPYDAPNSISSQALWDKYNCAMKDVRAVVMGTGGMHQASELDIDVVL